MEPIKPNVVRFLLGSFPAAAALLFLTGQTLLPASLPEQGFASWYGEPFHGRRAASGENYDMMQLTAAHRTLPFGARVRVHRLDREASVVVRINDRGPYVESRIIDLSLAAARQLQMTEPGVVPVALELVEFPTIEVMAGYSVQVGSFHVQDNARRTQAVMERDYGAARLESRGGDQPLWTVLVGDCATRAEAEELAARIRSAHKQLASAYVVRAGAGSLGVAD